jgi:hypothetical protein
MIERGEKTGYNERKNDKLIEYGGGAWIAPPAENNIH